MTESTRTQTDRDDSLETNNRAVTIQKVVVYYQAPDEHGALKDFYVEIDPAKAGAIVWNDKALNKFKNGKTLEEDPLPGELPVPKPRKSHEDQKEDSTTPEGTCCFINGRWVCWD